jgi:hypothetical protein
MIGKEKVKDLRDEGMRSQAFHRSGSSKSALPGGSPKLILALMSVLGILGLLVR